MDLIRVFIGYDRRFAFQWHLCAHSIMRRASRPVQILPLIAPAIKNESGHEPKKAATEFTFSRFFVPYLCGFKGFGIFMDIDMILQDDIAKFWDECVARARETGAALQVANHTTKDVLQRLNNQSSVMFFDAEQCSVLTPEFIAREQEKGFAPLHHFKWLPSGKVHTFGIEWNYLVSVYPASGVTPSLLHFTHGWPGCPIKPSIGPDFVDRWQEEYKHFMGTNGHPRPR